MSDVASHRPGCTAEKRQRRKTAKGRGRKDTCRADAGLLQEALLACGRNIGGLDIGKRLFGTFLTLKELG